MSNQQSSRDDLKHLRLALHLTGLAVALALVVVVGVMIYRPVHAEEARVRSVMAAIEDSLNRKGDVWEDADELENPRRESHRELSIHVSGEATYPALCRFLSGLEEVERLTRLTSLNVNGSYGGSDVYPVSMTVIIFFAQPADDATQTGALPGCPEDF